MEQTDDNVEREIHLYDYFEVLLRRKWVIILCFASIVLTAGIATYIMTPVYEASTSILIEESKIGGQALFAELAGLPQSSEIPSQIEIIKSRTIAEEVVRELKYDRRVFDISGKLDLRVTNLRIPEKFTGKLIKVKFTDNNGNFTVINTEDNEFLGKGIAGAPFNNDSGLSFDIKEANPYRGASFKIEKSKFNKTVRALQSNVSVTPVKNTNIANIKAQDGDPGMSAAIANSIVKHYIQQDISRRSKEATHVIKFVNNQLKPTQKKLEKSLEALAVHKRDSGVIDLKEGTIKLIEKISDLEKGRTALILREQQIKYLYDEVRGNAADISTLTLSVLEDPVIQSMINRLPVLESRKKSLLADYTERHPRVVALTAEINELKGKVIPSIRNIINSMRNKKESLSKEIDQIKVRLKELPDEEKRLAGLVLNKEVLSNINVFLFQKLNEATIAQASTMSLVQVIDPAIVPDKPLKPNKKQNILLAIIVGLFGSIGLAFFLEYLDNSIKSPRDVEERLGIPIFGRIPFIPAKKNGQRSNPDTGLITLESIKSVTAESFRSLRTNLQFAGLEKKGRIFHITSPQSSEGKSTITANLGITLALMGGKTLIIDLDLRKPTVHHIFGINKEPGITNLLTRTTTFQEIVKTTGFEHLYVIPAGIIPPNPSELLSQENLSAFLDEIREQFDFILIDSPPVLPVTDAQLLGRLADTSFLVIELGKTPFPAAEHSIAQLRNINVNVAGAIINKIQPSTGYGYYSYQYHYYYGEPEKKDSISKLKFWKKT